ncbi:flagellar protein FlgN [Brevibacillus laterosporus]|uniref:Flagellar protein FlgN n=1 Tax=Brevibacillus halotolerans TaxID=1507437 RepID=A0ABT4HSF8_9BACL|nr:MULTISPECIES: flagellar protein FlgN [Brevibacillus]MCR8984021.1 flagellar protein FlgN [Brevibacillus laterosporus]MCZ0829740.1 flagellar protein FlgN [Brevibacillus halotolerans]
MTHVNELFAVLDNLTELHQALYTLALEKREVLVKNDMQQLTDLIKKEQQLLKAVQRTELLRKDMTNTIFNEKGVTVTDGTLQDVIRLCTDVEMKNQLTQRREELLRVIGKLKEENEQNQQLLQYSLDFVNMSLDLFTDRPEEDFIYKNPGNQQIHSSMNRSIFNHKA